MVRSCMKYRLVNVMRYLVAKGALYHRFDDEKRMRLFYSIGAV